MYQIKQQNVSSSFDNCKKNIKCIKTNNSEYDEQFDFDFNVENRVEPKSYQKSIDFKEIGLPIPEIIINSSYEIQESVYCYLVQLGESERKTYCIAVSHLGSSFNLVKSNGYIKWKK